MDTADKNIGDLWRWSERASEWVRRRKVQIFVRYFVIHVARIRLSHRVGRSVLINTLALYPPLGWMVKTKDSAALFLPSTEALSHGRSARRIGRVRSHKRSLRNQFHLFVNTREDFHSPGGISPQDCVVVLALGPFHYFSTGTRIAIVARQKVPRRPESPIRSVLVLLFLSCPSVSSRFSSFLLKNNRRVAELAREANGGERKGVSRKRVKPRAANWLVTLTGNPPASSLIVLAFDEANTSSCTTGRAQGYNFIFRSLNALFCGLFTPPSVHARRFLSEKRPVLQPFAL